MKKDYSIGVFTKKVYRKRLFFKIMKVVLLLMTLSISLVYLLLYVMFQKDNFVITLDKNMSNRKNIYLSETASLKKKEIVLNAEVLENMDNISINWINENVDTEKDGAHNGSNYMAYTFYVFNDGNETVNYWYEIDIDDTVKNVDKAIRVMVYRNGVPTVYAKANEQTKGPEDGTKKFRSKNIAVLEQRKKFTPKSKDKYTLVVWIEGDDPDCTDDLIGGGMKMHMDITEEKINDKK